MKFKDKKWFKILLNKYIIIALAFVVWMLFFDTNSYLIHRELNQEVEKLEEDKAYFERETAIKNEQLKQLTNDQGIEKYAREEYFMKKENESVFIIEHADSLKKDEKN